MFVFVAAAQGRPLVSHAGKERADYRAFIAKSKETARFFIFFENTL
jgi:hypothetical protein